MPIPVWVLLGFATWTLFILFTTVGVYRWSRILTGRTAIAAWRADEQQGGEWYRRAIRAHLNCVENLPVYTAIVVALLATRVTSPILDGLAITILVARILLVEQTNTVATGVKANVRFGSKADQAGMSQGRRLYPHKRTKTKAGQLEGRVAL
jgi:uncharacterized MAPEG superfamily protein